MINSDNDSHLLRDEEDEGDDSDDPKEEGEEDASERNESTKEPTIDGEATASVEAESTADTNKVDESANDVLKLTAEEKAEVAQRKADLEQEDILVPAGVHILSAQGPRELYPQVAAKAVDDAKAKKSPLRKILCLCS